MHLLQLTFPEPTANVALDEALLETSEEAWSSKVIGSLDDSSRKERVFLETLRLWEPKSAVVVLGRSSPILQEVNLDYCRQYDVPVLRRCSGGATIVTGPGCLMYAVVLRYEGRSELRMLDQAHRYVLSQMQEAIARLEINVTIQGTSDLTIGDKKFSGNSMRSRQRGFLYHGTFICDFDLSLVEKCLGTPRRQPNYRGGRSHNQFLTRLPVSTAQLSDAIIEQWNAHEVLENWPETLTERLVIEKYRSPNWTEAV